MSGFKFDKDMAKFCSRFSPEKIMNLRIILQMSRSTTDVLKAVQETRNMCFIGLKTLLLVFKHYININGAPAARRAAERSSIPIQKGEPRACMEIETRNPCNSFFMSKWLAVWIAGA